MPSGYKPEHRPSSGVARYLYREAEVARVTRDVVERGGRPYVIDVGGSGVVGAYGQSLAGHELFDQLAVTFTLRNSELRL